jgi:hypothetical protein
MVWMEAAVKWLHKVSQPGKPWMVGIEIWIYGLIAVVLVVAYLVSRLRVN